MIELYEQHKGLLFRLAYQLTGSVSDAEDAVQDVFVKLHSVDPEKLTEPKAFLCKMVTNHCLDQLKSAKRRREQYVGPWLPEPLSFDESYDTVVLDDTLSYAMLVLLERLTPAERIVFVLREALSFDYPAIAELTGKSEMNCRKLMSRARRKMGVSEGDLEHSEAVEQEWMHQFLAALSKGRADTVMSLLAEDAVLLSDGGGKVFAAIRPIQTREVVAKFLLGLMRKEANKNASFELVTCHNETRVMIRFDGSITSVVHFFLKNGLLQNIYIVSNPDKLMFIK
ncbi:RNA polymerase sigma factor SigJ [Paenibacillus sp. KN14-4R]|uniref:RNA polymerase sigma factor SigJ n=1 Tax=Paenibacillus sp. KN14-4R TaxID=3445773 RepID=UPI003F9EFC31